MAPPTPPHAPRRPHVLSIHGDDRVDDWYWLRDRDDPGRARLPRGRERLRRSRARAGGRAPRAHLRRDPRRGCRRPTTRRRSPTATGATSPAPSRASSTRSTAAGRGPAAPSRSCSTRTCSPPGTTTSRSAASRSRPTIGSSRTRPTSPAASATRCASAISTPAPTSPTSSTNVTYGLAWADDARTCFYVRPDDAMRPNEVWRHGSARRRRSDALVFREDDERFFVDIGRTRSGPLRAHRDVVEDDVGDVVRAHRRARSTRPRSSRPASTSTSTASSTTRSEQHGDRFLIVTNERRRAQLQARRRAGRRPRTATTGSTCSRTATTCGSTRSTRSAITSC